MELTTKRLQEIPNSLYHYLQKEAAAKTCVNYIWLPEHDQAARKYL